MNKSILQLLFASFLVLTMSCNQANDGFDDCQIIEMEGPVMVTVCHNTSFWNDGPWIELQVSQRNLPRHLRHGDAVDKDGDGYFNIPNECNIYIDGPGGELDCNPDPIISCWVVWYVDGDEDGYGDPNAYATYPCGVDPCPCCVWSLNNDDCDDFDPDVPGVIPCNETFNGGNQPREEEINCEDFYKINLSK